MRATLSVSLLFFSFTTAVVGQSAADSGPDAYRPINNTERFHWFVTSTVGPASDIGGVISAAWCTWLNSPREYGPHWAGFGKRYGMRLTGISVSNATEAGLGALWGEDPRYIRAGEAPFKTRVGHIVKMTFFASGRDGRPMPAYARFVAIPGNNFLSDTWRVPSDATASRASVRTLLGFAGRMASNAFQEFWPDVRHRLFKAHNDETDVR